MLSGCSSSGESAVQNSSSGNGCGCGDVIVDCLRQQQHLVAIVSGDVCHAGFYRAGARVGITHAEFSHRLLEF
jgi:hypothetical protein